MKCSALAPSAMLLTQLYYQLKPALPRRLRLALRRKWAAGRRTRFATTWPIHEAAGNQPPGWKGWPKGKQFAFVLTHDVETQTGLDRCRDLMQLEQKLGFRSSFNFVPEGGYSVSKELRDELSKNGFEVGVHDFRHDGKLFRSRQAFVRHADRINHYLQEWNAVGFRAGFMLRNLEWFHDLHIRYDASTFDTDPFEPQPDGANTIFPFRINAAFSSNGGHDGYVELPYTLPQDSTLFLILREKTIDIWKRKLDWIAARGGMALVNTHPDYFRFQGSPKPGQEFAPSLYEELLNHVASHYQGKYWHALPKDVASHF